MLIAIGKIINKEDLIGLRVFDTDTKQNKDIKIEDANKIKIKNIKSIDKLGSIYNNQSEKPIIILDKKDNKYTTVDINGNVKVIMGMFYGCKKLTKLDLSYFDISNVKSMQEIE